MTTRTSRETVTFSRPFRIGGEADLLPAGSYLVETDEVLLENVSFPAYHRVSTIIHLAGRPNTSELERLVTIDPVELAAALANDALP